MKICKMLKAWFLIMPTVVLMTSVAMAGEEKGESFGEIVYIQATVKCCLHIGNAIGKSESNFLCCRCACFTYMITTYTYGVPAGHVFATVFEDVRDEFHAWLRGIDVHTAGYIFFKNVVL